MLPDQTAYRELVARALLSHDPQMIYSHARLVEDQARSLVRQYIAALETHGYTSLAERLFARQLAFMLTASETQPIYLFGIIAAAECIGSTPASNHHVPSIFADHQGKGQVVFEERIRGVIARFTQILPPRASSIPRRNSHTRRAGRYGASSLSLIESDVVGSP